MMPWDLLVSWEPSQRLDRKKCQDFCPVEIHVPLQNHPITVSQIIVSGSAENSSANLKIPLNLQVSFGELITKHNEYDVDNDIEAIVAHINADMWMVAEVAADQMTTAESADDKSAYKAAAERVAAETMIQMATEADKVADKPVRKVGAANGAAADEAIIQIATLKTLIKAVDKMGLIEVRILTPSFIIRWGQS